MKKILTYLVLIGLSILATFYFTKELNPCECDEIKEKQILTQLEMDLIHVKLVQQNWNRHLK
jgi:hypothetical protein